MAFRLTKRFEGSFQANINVTRRVRVFLRPNYAAKLIAVMRSHNLISFDKP